MDIHNFNGKTSMFYHAFIRFPPVFIMCPPISSLFPPCFHHFPSFLTMSHRFSSFLISFHHMGVGQNGRPKWDHRCQSSWGLGYLILTHSHISPFNSRYSSHSPCSTIFHHFSPCLIIVHHVSPCFHHCSTCLISFHHISLNKLVYNSNNYGLWYL